jgi:ATP-binding cassette subfamily B protein
MSTEDRIDDAEAGISKDNSNNKEGLLKEIDDKKSKDDDETAPQQASLLKVLSIATPEVPMMLVTLICVFLSEGSNLIIPIILANAYDALIERDVDESSDEVMSTINRIMITVVLISIVGIFIGFIRTLIQGIIGERLVARIRCRLYSSILKQEIAFFDEHKTGELVSRLGSDTTLLQTVISFAIPEVLAGVIRSITAVAFMFIISPKLAGLSLGGVAVIFLCSVPLGKALGRFSKEYQDELGEAQTHSTEAFGSMRTVQSFAAEKKEIERFERKIGNPDKYPLCPNLWWPVMKEGDVKSTYRVGFFKSMYNSAFFSMIFGGGFGFLNVSLWYGFYLINNGELSIGQLTAFQSYVFNIGFGLGQVGGNAAKVIEGLSANGRVFYLLDRVPKIPKPPSENGMGNEKKLKPSSMAGNVELKNVKFSYPSRAETLVLNDISLNIPSQTTTGKCTSFNRENLLVNLHV